MQKVNELMEEFEKNIIEGWADFKFIESEDSVDTNFNIHLTHNMAVTMILATLEQIKRDIREEAVDDILEAVITKYKGYKDDR